MMRWEKWGKTARRCVEHHLSISKAKVKDGWIYTLWRLSSIRNEKYGATYQATPDERLESFTTFEAAKEAAEELINGNKV